MQSLLERAGALWLEVAARLDSRAEQDGAKAGAGSTRWRVLLGFSAVQTLLLLLALAFEPAGAGQRLAAVLVCQIAVFGLVWRGASASRCAHLALFGTLLLAALSVVGVAGLGAVELLFAIGISAYCLLGSRAALGWFLLGAGVFVGVSAAPTATTQVSLAGLPNLVVWLCAAVALGLHEYSNTQARRLQALRKVTEAGVDAATGMVSLPQLQCRIGEAMEHARRNGTLVGAVTVTLENWSQLAGGDGRLHAALIHNEAAVRIQRELRQTDLAAPASSACFHLILCNLKSRRGMDSVITRLQASLLQPVLSSTGPRHLRISVGTAVFPFDAERADDLFDVAKQDGERAHLSRPKILRQAFN